MQSLARSSEQQRVATINPGATAPVPQAGGGAAAGAVEDGGAQAEGQAAVLEGLPVGGGRPAVLVRADGGADQELRPRLLGAAGHLAGRSQARQGRGGGGEGGRASEGGVGGPQQRQVAGRLLIPPGSRTCSGLRSRVPRSRPRRRRGVAPCGRGEISAWLRKILRGGP